VWKPEGKKQLGKLQTRCGDNIKINLAVTAWVAMG
jgi:hypothetical protein